MRNKVGQEATGEMSAFKGVVNLCIVVLPHLSQHVTCFQGGPRTNPENTQVLSDCETAREKAPLVRIFGSDSFYLQNKQTVISESERKRSAYTCLTVHVFRRGAPAGPTLLALKWRPDEVSVILGAHRLQVEASLPRRLSVWALWMMKAAKMLSHLSVTSLGAKRNPLSLRKERTKLQLVLGGNAHAHKEGGPATSPQCLRSPEIRAEGITGWRQYRCDDTALILVPKGYTAIALKSRFHI